MVHKPLTDLPPTHAVARSDHDPSRHFATRIAVVARVAVVVILGAAMTGCGLFSPNEGPVADTPEGRAVEAVKSHFAQAQDLSEDQIAVTGIEEVTWDTSALGCPEPDESYAQVLTPGYRIEVLTDEGTVVYHTDRPESDEPARIVQCDEPAQAGTDAFGGPALELARQDLAERIGVAEADLELEAGFPAPVSRLICDDQLGATAEPGPRRVILEFHLAGPDDVHVYRAWGDEILYCGTTEGLIFE